MSQLASFRSLRDDESLARTEQWFACYTRARHEKQVAIRLEQRSLESFCPVLPQERQWHDRVKLIEWPLFPSYVFVRCATSGLAQVLSVPGAVSIVALNGAPVPIDAEEIDNVRRFAAALAAGGQVAEPAPFIGAGTRVRIASGPFIGVEGMVIEHRGRDRVLVGLEAISQCWEVVVPVASIEPLPEQHPSSRENVRRSPTQGGRRISHV